MFYKEVALESFAKFTGKHLCWNHFLIKLQALRKPTTSVFLLSIFSNHPSKSNNASA